MPVSSVWFLGANTPSGFASLYESYLASQPGQYYLVKGCPGCGKSTFFRHLSRAAEDLGLEQEIILCSGDPDSLDGVYFPAIGIGYMDATAPHVLEPTCPGGKEIYLDFSRFLNTDGLKQKAEELTQHIARYKAGYHTAYRYLGAMGHLEAQKRNLSQLSSVRASMEKQVYDILPLILDTCAGTQLRRYLTGMTAFGCICLSQTLSALCPRVIAVESEYGIAGGFLQILSEKASHLELAHILCPDPLYPQEPAAVLFPSIGLGFLQWNGSTVSLPEPCRILSPDSAIPGDLRDTQEELLSTIHPAIQHITTLAVSALQEANRKHSELENTYHPYVDFAGVSELGYHHAAILKSLSHAVRS